MKRILVIISLTATASTIPMNSLVRLGALFTRQVVGPYTKISGVPEEAKRLFAKAEMLATRLAIIDDGWPKKERWAPILSKMKAANKELDDAMTLLNLDRNERGLSCAHCHMSHTLLFMNRRKNVPGECWPKEVVTRYRCRACHDIRIHRSPLKEQEDTNHDNQK